ncbi:hypothetical protein RRV45_16000 [Bacillus sp. DTU_2020_1000418_1_SI_GHA_SEK_038]|uniref:hypothetical protein n=1 Tax=Bacillus sp. DTU_2020_1000418_1_SI_GHA_SEK_038 TaxID=3077585 RepID=UPI0028EB4C27|nr:hypothetical protein [Bacillus sp. DTU_2020_1000418_1_SI_GHA_SEK_038]WNS74402.1 hypothetical protein RRV45_16000 [Bacillus sp. DTU_2020_1000418_1_SI_GHA_SEK_038]
MGKWNEEAAANNNMTAVEIKSSKLSRNKQVEFSEELSDAGERNERFNKPRYNKK